MPFGISICLILIVSGSIALDSREVALRSIGLPFPQLGSKYMTGIALTGSGAERSPGVIVVIVIHRRGSRGASVLVLRESRSGAGLLASIYSRLRCIIFGNAEGIYRCPMLISHSFSNCWSFAIIPSTEPSTLAFSAGVILLST